MKPRSRTFSSTPVLAVPMPMTNEMAMQASMRMSSTRATRTTAITLKTVRRRVRLGNAQALADRHDQSAADSGRYPAYGLLPRASLRFPT